MNSDLRLGRASRVLWQAHEALADYPSVEDAIQSSSCPLQVADCWITLSRRGTQFELNGVGALLWESLSTPQRVTDLSSYVRSVFDVGSIGDLSSLDSFFASLLEHRLVEQYRE